MRKAIIASAILIAAVILGRQVLADGQLLGARGGGASCNDTRNWDIPWQVSCVAGTGGASIQCPGNDVLLSGGCACGGAITENRPNGVKAWTCACEGADAPVHAWAVCIPVQVAADMKVPIKFGGH